MRGSGGEGLISMAPGHGQHARPLIETSRTEIEGYLKSLGQGWRTDRTNMDMSFARNRIRHEILPRLASLFNAATRRQFEQNDRNPATGRPVDA